MPRYRALLLVGIMGPCGAALPSEAKPINVTAAVQSQCRWDYHNFCSEHGLLLLAQEKGH
jgi:hypothetical protein